MMGAFFANFMAIVTVLAPGIQTTGNPGAGYTWSLGDLAGYSTRLDMDWETGAWADAYDTEAELVALWGTATTIAAASCTATNDAADESTVATQLSTLCGGAPPRDCGGKVAKFESSCDYDMTAGAGNSDSAPALNFGYSNLALVGGGMDSTRINCNDTFADNTSVMGPCAANASSGAYGNPEVGSSFTWDATTGAKGRGGNTTDNAIIATADSGCANFAANEGIRLRGTDAGGNTIIINSRIAAVATSGSDCKIQITTPLYGALTPVSVISTTSSVTSKTIVMGMTIGFPNAPDGANSNAGAGTQGMRVIRSNEFLLVDSRIGPYGPTGIDLRAGNIRPVIKSNELGPCQKCKRNGTASGVLTANTDGGALVFINNNMVGAAKRMASVARASSWGSWWGFNYQDAFDTDVVGETGNHCDGVGSPVGFPMVGFSPSTERNIFVGHDSESLATGERVGGFLAEANDLNCKLEYDAGSVTASARYTTYYRNRSNKYMGTIDTPTGSREYVYQNFIANRFKTWTLDNDAVWPDALGINNAAVTTMDSLTSTGTTWPTASGAGRNYATGSSAHENYPLDYPPSLALKTNTAPSWWCTQSGPWNGTWNFGAGDGYGGNTYKLPAQIRYEGTTCTPP